MGQHIEGWMTSAELQWIASIARQVHSSAEVGCWKGRTTDTLLTETRGPVYAVDHWKGSEAEREGPHREATERDIFADFMGNVGHFPNLCVRRGCSTEVAPTLPLIDFVFIDAGHTYEEVRADLEAWTPKTLRIIAGHDYHIPEVKRAVDEKFGDQVKVAAESIWFVLNPSPVSVMFGTPCFGGQLFLPYHLSMLKTLDYLRKNDIGYMSKYIDADSLVPRARISLFGQFLSSTATHLLFIDADIDWHARDVLRMMKADKPVVAAIYRKKKQAVEYPMNFFPETFSNLPYDPESGCFEIKDAPTGFLMIRKDAALRMAEAYADRRCMIGEGGWDAECNRNTFDLFPCLTDADGMYLSEDYGFCRLWQRIGGKVWMLPDVELGHTGKDRFAGKISDIITRVEDDEARRALLQKRMNSTFEFKEA